MAASLKKGTAKTRAREGRQSCRVTTEAPETGAAVLPPVRQLPVRGDGLGEPVASSILTAVLRTASRAALGVIDADRSIAATIPGPGERDGRLIVHHEGGDLDLPVAVVRHVGRLVRRRAAFALGDLALEPRAPWHTALKGGVRALAAVRLQLDTISGVLMVLRDTPRCFSSCDIARLQGVARGIGDTVGETQALVLAERSHLGRELHDTFGQTLTCLIFAIDELEGGLWSAEHRLLTRAVRSYGLKAVRQIRELIDSAVRATERGEEHSYRISDLLKVFSHSGVAVHFRSDPNLQSIPGPVGVCLYNVAREALLNVNRHARATHVDVRLTRRDGAAELLIADDGRGFREEDGVRRGWGGFGLRMMRERVEEIGGTFVLQTTPGKGTRVFTRVRFEGRRGEAHDHAGEGRPRRRPSGREGGAAANSGPGQ